LYFRINGSHEERNEALMEDAAAFGIGCSVVGVVQFVIGASSIAVLNFAAQKQVINTAIVLWNVSVGKFIIFIMILKKVKCGKVHYIWSTNILQIFSLQYYTPLPSHIQSIKLVNRVVYHLDSYLFVLFC
jgi:hypothetical protein